MTLFRWVLCRGEREAGFAWKQRLALRDTWRVLLHHPHQLSEDTTNRPDIDSWPVILFKEDDLRRPIPPRLHMSCQLSLHISPCIFSLDQFRSHLLFFLYVHCRFELLILERLSLAVYRHGAVTSQASACCFAVFLFVNF